MELGPIIFPYTMDAKISSPYKARGRIHFYG